MNVNFSPTRKIDPSKSFFTGDNSPNDMDCVEYGSRRNRAN